MTDMKETAEKIRKYINEYDDVFVFGDRIPVSEKTLQAISKQRTKQVLLLMNGLKMGNIQKYGVDIQTISYEEYCDIESLYYMYEFSDCVCLLNDSAQYGRLKNYISNGLLTEEETIMALLFG